MRSHLKVVLYNGKAVNVFAIGIPSVCGVFRSLPAPPVKKLLAGTEVEAGGKDQSC